MKTEIPDISIFTRIAIVQNKRRDNWRPGFPIDPDLEHAHQAELAILRKSLSAGQVAEPEKSPIQPESNLYRGGFFGWVGNLFKSILP